MTISANFPNVQPSLLLDFANAKQLPPQVTFTRATTAAYYDGSTTAKAEQNLQIYSQEFNSWTGNLCSVTANTTAAPDGTTTADTVAQTVTSGEHYLYRTDVICTADVPFTLSIYAKNVDQNYIQFSVSNNSLYANFDLSSGVVGSSYLVTSSSITSVGGGWYRCVVTVTPGANGFFFIGFINSASAGRISIYTPASATSVYLWGAQVEQRSSVTAYTATSTQQITNYVPVLLTAGGGQPRFDHNPTTSESLGLLIEEQRTNVLQYSANLSVSPWTTSSVSVTASTIIAPDGTLSGNKIIPDATNNVHYIRQLAGSSANYTFSCYFKAAEYASVVMLGVGANHGGAFNLSSGTVTATYGSASAAISSVGNGWYRCSISLTVSGTDFYIYVDNAGAYTGNGFSGVYAWGGQLEAAAFPTSYIPTTSASATRAADFATMTGVNFSSWFNNGQGTFVTQFMMPSPTGQLRRLWDIENTNTAVYTNLMAFNGYSGSNSIMYFEGSSGNSTQFAIDTGSYAANTSYRVAMAYQVNDFAASTSGGSVQTDTVGTLPLGLNALWLGSHRDGNWYNGYINKFAYYPLRVTNAQLQALSS